VTSQDLGEDGAKVGGEGEVAPFVQLLALEPGPPAVHLAALHLRADDEHRPRVAVVGAARAVLARHAPKLGHRQDHDVVHAIAHVGDEGGNAVAKVTQSRGQLTRAAPLVHVRVPPADVGKGELHPESGLDELCNLEQALAKGRPRVLGAVLRAIALRVGAAQHLHGLEHLAPRGVHEVGGAGAIERLES
jgi:hypothetical protein